jgi:Rhodopirellula transposase DDE domain
MVHATLDAGTYKKGRKVANKELATINLTPSRFHGEWNYVIRPNTKRRF